MCATAPPPSPAVSRRTESLSATTPSAFPLSAAGVAAPPRLRLRPPEDFGLPADYRQQAVAMTHDQIRPESEPAYWNADRLSASGRYQYHVYAWAATLITKLGLKSVLDVGCGPATKLARLIHPVCPDIEGVDQPSGIAAARATGAPGRFTAIDLENPTVAPWRRFDLIICSDVVEHLIDPDPMLRFIREFCTTDTLVLFSTPDRARLHGRACRESNKPEHVREWTHPEFIRFLRSRGFTIDATRLFPADDVPVARGRWHELLWRLRLRHTSPHRCQTVLCRQSGPAGPAR